MKVLILSASSGIRKDKTPYFKAMISPQDSEGTAAASMEFYIQPEDFALVQPHCPCVADSGYRFRAESNERGFQCLGIQFGGFTNVQPLAFASVPSAPPSLPEKSAKSA